MSTGSQQLVRLSAPSRTNTAAAAFWTFSMTWSTSAHENDQPAVAVHVPQQADAEQRDEHQQDHLEVAERGRAVDPPGVVGDDAVEQQQHADGELGEEPPPADLEQLVRLAQLGPGPGQV